LVVLALVDQTCPMNDLPPDRATARRTLRPGAFVVLVGPDGVGKTTVARHLLRIADGQGAYLHFNPPLMTDLATALPAPKTPPGKAPLTGSRVLGWVRILRNLVRFWAGYILRVRPAVRRGMLVVADRWGYGYLVQPTALKFYGPDWMADRVVALFPHPDLVANLTAPPEIILARKAELSLEQIRTELKGWARLQVPMLRSFDTEKSANETAASIAEVVGW